VASVGGRADRLDGLGAVVDRIAAAGVILVAADLVLAVIGLTPVVALAVLAVPLGGVGIRIRIGIRVGIRVGIGICIGVGVGIGVGASRELVARAVVAIGGPVAVVVLSVAAQVAVLVPGVLVRAGGEEKDAENDAQPAQAPGAPKFGGL
jgi:hypothetical protein